jgi:glyoxylase-like metal-dependent hydrolase (beta-lactamase superfamily II)
MLTTSLTVGHIEVIALLDGVRDLGGPMTDSFPDVPAEELESFRERMPGVYGENGAWRLHVRAWLLRHPGGLALVDTGVGQTGAPGPSWFGAPGQLLEALRETGTPPDAVDTVVLTHVHDDHVGGGVVFADGEPVPAFPRATYLMQRADRTWQSELAREDPEDREIDELLVQPLERHGRLTLIEGDHRVADGIDLHPAPGHTPGHQIVRLHSRSARAILTGDTFNHPVQIPHPDRPSGTDVVPAQAAATRRSVLAEVLSHPGTTIAPTHLDEPFGRIVSGSGGLTAWRPL